MIAGVRGTIAALEAQAVVVDLHGFLVRVHTSARALASLGMLGDPVELYTHLLVREDALALYGFPDRTELDLFELLLGVSGVGPKVALNLLAIPVAALYDAISNEDVAALTRAPGVGKSTASRIIFDLRRKLPDVTPGFTGPIEVGDRDALAALEALGYTPAEARNALAAVEGRNGLSVEDRVFQALQRLTSG